MYTNTRPARHYRWAALAMADTPRIETRLRAILSSSTRPLGVRSWRLQTGATLLCGAALVGGLAVLRPAVRAAEPIAAAPATRQKVDFGWVYRPAPGSDSVRLPSGVTVEFKGIQPVRPNERIASYGHNADGTSYPIRKILPSTPLGPGWNLEGVRNNVDALFANDLGVARPAEKRRFNPEYFRSLVVLAGLKDQINNLGAEADLECGANSDQDRAVCYIESRPGQLETAISVGVGTGEWIDAVTFPWPSQVRKVKESRTDWQPTRRSDSLRILADPVYKSTSAYYYRTPTAEERKAAVVPSLYVSLTTWRPIHGSFRAFVVDRHGVRQEVRIVGGASDRPPLLETVRGLKTEYVQVRLRMTADQVRTTKQIVLQSQPIDCVFFDHVPLHLKTAAN